MGKQTDDFGENCVEDIFTYKIEKYLSKMRMLPNEKLVDVT
jgi:hypothetical protein